MTTLPCLPEARLRSNAAAASESANVESIATRSSPLSARCATSSCSRFGSTTKYVPSRLFGDRDETPAASEQGTRAFEEVATNRVEDEIDPADRLVQLLSAVDYLVRSERACGVERVGRRGRDHMGAAPVRQLRRELADTADSSVDEHLLAGCEAAVNEETLPGAECRQRTAALCTWLSEAGFGARIAAGTAAYSAATPSRSNGVNAYISSPTETSATSSPIAATTPDSSYDGTAGSRSSGHSSSSRVIAAACTSTTTSPARSNGVSIVSCRRPATPGECSRIASIVRLVVIVKGILPLARYSLASFFSALYTSPVSGPHDHVDEIVAQWRRERPELDVALGVYGRLFRVVHLSDDELAKDRVRAAAGMVRPPRRAPPCRRTLRAQPDEPDARNASPRAG